MTRSPGGLRGGLAEGDLVAQVLELFDEAVPGAVGVDSPSEVVAAQILVVAVVGEQVPADDQDGVAYGDGRLLLADPPGQAPELGREVSVAGVGGGPGALRKDVAQPDVALGGLARVAPR